MAASAIEYHVIGHTANNEQIIERLERVSTRKIDRAVARYNMKRKGYTHVAKRSYSKSAGVSGNEVKKRDKGYFSLNWKENR